MPLNLFSDNKYVKLDELHKEYQTKLYQFLKERKFILSNEHYLTYDSKQSKIGITMFENKCVDDSKPERESWHEFSVYQIEFIPNRIVFKYRENYNEDNFNIEETNQDYKLYIEVKNFLKKLFDEYKAKYKEIMNNALLEEK